MDSIRALETDMCGQPPMEIILEQPNIPSRWIPIRMMYLLEGPHWHPLTPHGLRIIWSESHWISLGCGRSPGTILALRVGPSLVVPEVDFLGGRGSKLVDNSKSLQLSRYLHVFELYILYLLALDGFNMLQPPVRKILDISWAVFWMSSYTSSNSIFQHL
jgi:hypothetical protein